MTGIELITAERQRQIESEGWTPEHDDEHDDEEIAAAAAYYASPEKIFVHRDAEGAFFSGNTGDRGDRQLREEGYYEAWPWDEKWNKKDKHDRLKQLTIAGALILAEIDRIQRKEK